MNSISAREIILIASSFLFALLISILPLPNWLKLLWPAWTPLILIYWVLVLPQRINLGIAWLLGLLLDGLYGTLLGEHALALAVVAYIVDHFHRQIRMFPVLQQAVSIFFLILAYQTLLVWIQGMLGLFENFYLFWLTALTSMLIWPWLYLLLHNLRQRFYSTNNFR